MAAAETPLTTTPARRRQAIRVQASIARLSRFWPHAALVVVLGAFVALAAPAAGRPYLFDEANFLFQARAIAERGVPYANMGYMGDRGAITTREQYGLWHPPLYLGLLGLNYALFGGSEVATRGMGIAAMLATIALVYALGHTLGGAGRRGVACGVLAAALFAVSPLVIQSALIIDIDGTVLAPLVTLWALVYLRWQATLTWRRALVLGGLLALALWAKTTTPLLLPVALLLHQALAGRWRWALAGPPLIVGVGVGGFLASWGLVAAVLGLPFAFPFEWNTWQLTDASNYTRGWLGSWDRMREEMAPAMVWLSPWLVGLFGVILFGRAAALLRTRRALPVDFLLILSAMILGAYFIKLAANFPKYHVGLLPFLAVAVAWWLLQAWSSVGWRARCALAGVFLGLTVWHLVAVGDAWMWTVSLVWEPLPMGVAILLFVAATVAALLPRARALGASLGLTLVALYASWALAVDVSQSAADYSTNYYYGTRGQRDAAALLNRLRYDGPWVGPKEVGWYARNQFYIDSDSFWWLVIARQFQFTGQVLGHDVPVVMIWTMDPHVRYFFEMQIGDQYVPVGEAADYSLWVRRDRLSALRR